VHVGHCRVREWDEGTRREVLERRKQTRAKSNLSKARERKVPHAGNTSGEKASLRPSPGHAGPLNGVYPGKAYRHAIERALQLP
jgi:hypothetical protein